MPKFHKWFLVVLVPRYQHSIVTLSIISVKLDVKVSFTPSNTIEPPLDELNVGPLISVPPEIVPTKSFHVVPVVGYDLVFAASK
jgi:hypothetical protein